MIGAIGEGQFTRASLTHGHSIQVKAILLNVVGWRLTHGADRVTIAAKADEVAPTRDTRIDP